MINQLNTVKQVVANNPAVVTAIAGLAVGAAAMLKRKNNLSGAAQWMSVAEYEQMVADKEGVDRNDLLEDKYVVIDA